jgi:predicted transposase YdaD
MAECSGWRCGETRSEPRARAGFAGPAPNYETWTPVERIRYVDRDDELRARAPALWRTVQGAPVSPDVRDVLAPVLEFWFFERFRGLTAKEIWAMLNLVTPIQETRAYQSIFAEGKIEGKAEGKVSVLKRQLTRRFGALPAWAERRIDAASVAQLDAWLDGIFDAESLAALIGSASD